MVESIHIPPWDSQERGIGPIGSCGEVFGRVMGVLALLTAVLLVCIGFVVWRVSP